MEPRVFVCHAKSDIEATSDIVDLLETALELPPGALASSSLPGYSSDVRSEAELYSMLCSSQVILALFTAKSAQDTEFCFELGAAWALGIRIVPLLTGTTGVRDLPWAVRNMPPVQAQDRAAWLRLVQDLAGHVGVRVRAASEARIALDEIAASASIAPPASSHSSAVFPALRGHALTPGSAAVSGVVESAAATEPQREAEMSSLPSSEMSFEAGRALSECVFHRDQPMDFARELSQPFGRFVDALGGKWQDLSRLQDLDVWTAVTDNLLHGLPPERQHLTDWYELGYEVTTLHNIAGQIASSRPDEHAELEALGHESFEHFLERAEAARIPYQELARVLGLLENLMGPPSQRDFTNVTRSVEELRRQAASADRQNVAAYSHTRRAVGYIAAEQPTALRVGSRRRCSHTRRAACGSRRRREGRLGRERGFAYVASMRTLATTEAGVDAVLAQVGKRLLLTTPLALGKPNHLLNAFYRRAKTDPSIELTIHTALTLQRPTGNSYLERRFLGPLTKRVFGNYPDLDYELDRMADRLPPNVRVIEFYFPAGKYLHTESAQRDCTSTNYTHVARDLLARGVNVLVQQVAAGIIDGRPRLSLSCNPDLTLDMVAKLRAEEKLGRAIAVVVQVNDQLPFMYGDALVAPDFADFVIDAPAQSYTLFGPPKLSVSDADHMIGLYGSTLIKDGGELQVGIGALGDAIVYALKLRQADNAAYLRAIESLRITRRFADEIARCGETAPFSQGLFAATEMLVDGFMHLFDAGIVKRKVYDDVTLSRLLNEGRITEEITSELLSLLRTRRAIHSVLTEEDLTYLQHFGILQSTLSWQDDKLVLPDGQSIVADLADPATYALLSRHLGARLARGAVIHAGFFLGPQAFYQWLRELPEEKRKLIDMRSVTRINQLYGHEEIDRLHRRNARFINTTMMMTLLGAACSDALEDGRVVSGVGGQYNFVAMAHELPDGRSVLQLRSTRMENGAAHSNMVWSYGNITIPRHLRDLVITEYGIADLRGRTDEECIIALLNISDSRFQAALLDDAKRRGKVRKSHVIPEPHRHNLPVAYQKPLAQLKAQGLFPPFPFGTDLDADEQKLGRALRVLKAKTATKAGLARAIRDAVTHGAAGDDVEPLLRRMDLHAPRTVEDRLYQRLLTATLRSL